MPRRYTAVPCWFAVANRLYRARASPAGISAGCCWAAWLPGVAARRVAAPSWAGFAGHGD